MSVIGTAHYLVLVLFFNFMLYACARFGVRMLDSVFRTLSRPTEINRLSNAILKYSFNMRMLAVVCPVSYTHLTLPTIYSV